MTGRKWPGTGLGKRPSSEADLDDAPGREARLLRAADHTRKHYERQRDQALKERDLAKKGFKETAVLYFRAQKASEEWRQNCSKVQQERDELNKSLWHMRGRDIFDLPDEKLEELADDIAVAKERVDAMLLRRKAEALVLDMNPDYRCPISLALMRDPVVTDDGQSYERKEIEAWFKKLSETNEPITSPLRAPLKSAQLKSNHSLRRAIDTAVRAEEPNCMRLDYY